MNITCTHTHAPTHTVTYTHRCHPDHSKEVVHTPLHCTAYTYTHYIYYTYPCKCTHTHVRTDTHTQWCTQPKSKNRCTNLIRDLPLPRIQMGCFSSHERGETLSDRILEVICLWGRRRCWPATWCGPVPTVVLGSASDDCGRSSWLGDGWDWHLWLRWLWWVTMSSHLPRRSVRSWLKSNPRAARLEFIHWGCKLLLAKEESRG